jgi:hypothetical protein
MFEFCAARAFKKNAVDEIKSSNKLLPRKTDV